MNFRLEILNFWTSILICLLFVVGIFSCSGPETRKQPPEHSAELKSRPQVVWPPESASDCLDSLKIAAGFDFPVGPPDGNGYYNAQGFQENDHLGDDWNGVGGGNSDLGDSVFAIGRGRVFFAEDLKDGWGNVVRMVHVYEELDSLVFVESLYAHLDSFVVEPGQELKRGQFLGTIGDAHGAYYAHLHLEIRSKIDLPVGGGYDTDTTGFLDPTAFIRAHRPR